MVGPVFDAKNGRVTQGQTNGGYDEVDEISIRTESDDIRDETTTR